MSENEYVEPLCLCGKRFIEHSEPCKYWSVDCYPDEYRHMWRIIIWPARASRNPSIESLSDFSWIMPVLTNRVREFNKDSIVNMRIKKAECEDMGINYKEIGEDHG